MGSWLRLATAVLRDRPGIRHAILLTDGKNESEGPEGFEEALGEAMGVFECDCRGVGTNWIVSELRTVATTLLGSCDMVANPENLEQDFSNMLAQSLRKQVAAVALRIWTPKGAQLLDLTQLQQEEAPLPLTGTRVEVDDLTSEYGTGAWENETRDFYLGVRVPVGEIGEERLGARVSLIVDGETAGQALVRTIWTDDSVKSTRMNRRVARARNEEELADAAPGRGRLAPGRRPASRPPIEPKMPVRIADAEGNDDVKERIATMYDEDPLTGRLRPKAKVDEAMLMDLEAKSTKTTSRAARPQGSDDALARARAGMHPRRRTTATGVAWPWRLRRSRKPARRPVASAARRRVRRLQCQPADPCWARATRWPSGCRSSGRWWSDRTAPTSTCSNPTGWSSRPTRTGTDRLTGDHVDRPHSKSKDIRRRSIFRVTWRTPGSRIATPC